MRLMTRTVLLVLCVSLLCSCKISGTITDESGSPVADVKVRLTGKGVMTTTTDSAGRYQFSARRIANGAFKVTPVSEDYRFDPEARQVDVAETDVDGIDFIAVPLSGCRTSVDCGGTAFCQKAIGECDGLGQCGQRTENCIALWDPVCGCDGKTYSNFCYAARAGVSVQSEGECGGGPVGELKSSLERDTAPELSADDAHALVAGNTDFALALYQQLRAAESGNLFYSPYSISTALAMLYAGAAADTETQMAEALHFTLPQATLHTGFNSLDLELESRGEGAAGADGGEFRLNISNAVWLQQDFPVLSTYLDLLAVNYGAGLRLLDFILDTEQSRLTINAWVAKQTEDRIKDLMPPGSITQDTRMVLTNAVYFNAAWLNPFNEKQTRSEPFYLLDGSSATAPMMHLTVHLNYFETDEYQAVEIPYDGRELSMVAIIPNAGQFETVDASLDSTLVDTVITGKQNTYVSIAMPQWEYRSKFGLSEILSAMGMTDAFIPGAANLSGIDGARDLFVQSVVHEAFIKVNEAGTEAAAATGIAAGGTSIQPIPTVVRLDRPFIYLIRDIPTQTVLFVGRVVDPVQ